MTQPSMFRSSRIKSLLLITLSLSCSNGFVHNLSVKTNKLVVNSSSELSAVRNDQRKIVKNTFISFTLASMVSLSTINPAVVQGYNNEFDTGEDTVEVTILSLKETTGDSSASFKVFESINDIITEGKGVGGTLSAKGVNLERGFVSDEDTNIYNPGLSLLTESEKNHLLEAMIDNRKGNIAKNTWNQDNEYAFDFIKTRLDPLHMVELKGYLGILPFYGAAVYVVSLCIQQFARDSFSVAYIVSAIAIFLPIAVLIGNGV